MDTIYIYGGQKDTHTKLSGIYTYCLKSGSIIGDSNIGIEDSEALNNTALKLRDAYSEYIYSLNQYFLDENLIYKKTISLFFFSDLSNKRTEIFDTFASICHLHILNDLISMFRIKKIIIGHCSQAFECALRSKFSYLNIVSYRTQLNRRYRVRELLSQFKFILISIIKRIILGLYAKNEPKSKDIPNLFFSIFPLLLNQQLIDEKYKSLVKRGDILLASVLTDGMHQSQSINSYKNNIKSLSQKPEHILLDRYIYIRDFIRASFYLIWLVRKKKKILKKQYLFQGIDISKFISLEIEQSFIRLPRLILYHYPLKRIFNKFQVTNFHYYLHEYSFGRFLTYVLQSEFQNVNTTGFQHGPASQRRLLYILAKGEADQGAKNWLKTLPIPDAVLAEDIHSQKLYIQQGYKNVNVMETIYRIDYLEEINRNINSSTILIVPGLHDGLSLLQKLKEEIASHKDMVYLLKAHPRSSMFKNGIPDAYKFPNLELVKDHISTYLETASEVIVTYSSVGYEAWKLGIAVKVVCLPDRINESPLLDYVEYEKSGLIKITW